MVIFRVARPFTRLLSIEKDSDYRRRIIEFQSNGPEIAGTFVLGRQGKPPEVGGPVSTQFVNDSAFESRVKHTVSRQRVETITKYPRRSGPPFTRLRRISARTRSVPVGAVHSLARQSAVSSHATRRRATLVQRPKLFVARIPTASDQ